LIAANSPRGWSSTCSSRSARRCFGRLRLVLAVFVEILHFYGVSQLADDVSEVGNDVSDLADLISDIGDKVSLQSDVVSL
jgi:hypothetical protein